MVLALTRRTFLGAGILGSQLRRVFGADNKYPRGGVVKIIVPYATGGLSSLFAQLAATGLEEQFDNPFIIESRPGANTTLGTLAVINAVPDGYTLLINTNSVISTTASIYKVPPYNPLVDLSPVASLARVPLVLVVNAKLPVRSLPDLGTLAKTTSGGLFYGSPGVGTSQHLFGELLKRSLKIEATHVPYNGPSRALNDVAGGHITFMFSDILSALPLIQSDKLRPIGLTTEDNISAIPAVPPLAKIGLPEFFNVNVLFMLFAPARTQRAIVADLNGKLRQLMGDQRIRERLSQYGIIPIESPPPEELEASLREDVSRWATLVKKAGLSGSQ